MKKMILKEVGTLYPSEFTPAQLITRVKYLIETHDDTLSFKKLSGEGLDSWYIGVMIDVMESDSDYEKRKRYEVQDKSYEDYERKLYDTLKSKFEN
jgi:hypothetical protein